MGWVGYFFLGILGIFCTALAFAFWINIRGGLIKTVGRYRLYKIRDDVRFLRVIGVPSESRRMLEEMDGWANTYLRSIERLTQGDIRRLVGEADRKGYLDEVHQLGATIGELAREKGFARTVRLVSPRFDPFTLLPSHEALEGGGTAFETLIQRALQAGERVGGFGGYAIGSTD